MEDEAIPHEGISFTISARFSAYLPHGRADQLSPGVNTFRHRFQAHLRRSLLAASALLAHGGLRAAELKFDFGSETAGAGYTRVAPGLMHDAQRGFGFTQTTPAPPVFAVDLDEGNYDVTIKFGHAARATSTTVKAEQRRLMIEKVETAPGQFATRTFTVNARKPQISAGGSTVLNTRELGPPLAANWDDQLTLEFNGKQPGVAALEIIPAKEALTIFLAGDSTVTDQPREPWSSWGQMLPRFFQQGVAIANHAESGLALSSFQIQRRLEKILSVMKKGDYLFIQFGHNDQKSKAPGAGPFTAYAANLKRFIGATRAKGGIPVLVTSVERRKWEGDQLIPTLADYAEATRQVGRQDNVPVIDLHAMSIQFYVALGPERSKAAFAHYPAHTYPGQTAALKDNTHHNAYGGYELARCVVEGIKTQLPDLAARLTKDAGAFAPANPDPPEKVQIPASASRPLEKPAGS